MIDAPDEMVEAVARIAPKPDGNGEHFVEMVLDGNRHCAWLRGSPRLIAALAEVIARDAKVRAEVDETRARCEREQLGHDGTMWEAADLGVAIAALYPEAGKPDDSDIMPGSEFDGPVVL